MTGDSHPTVARVAAPSPRPRRRWPVLALTAVAILSGCATQPAQPPPGTTTESWTGRFSADWIEPTTLPRPGRATGRFVLEREAGRTRLEVSSPFGQTIARALVSPGKSTLETADGGRHEAESAESLTESVLGWKVPVARLADWLSASDGVRTTADWRVDVERDDSGQPRRLTLEWPRDRESPEAPGVRIRLLVDPRSAQGADRP